MHFCKNTLVTEPWDVSLGFVIQKLKYIISGFSFLNFLIYFPTNGSERILIGIFLSKDNVKIN